jgi:hypothetical protein
VSTEATAGISLPMLTVVRAPFEVPPGVGGALDLNAVVQQRLHLDDAGDLQQRRQPRGGGQMVADKARSKPCDSELGGRRVSHDIAAEVVHEVAIGPVRLFWVEEVLGAVASAEAAEDTGSLAAHGHDARQLSRDVDLQAEGP